MKAHRKKIIFAGVLLLLLLFSYFFSGIHSSEKTESYSSTEEYSEAIVYENEQTDITLPEKEMPVLQKIEASSEIEKTEKEPEEKNELYCTITIKCDTILNNMEFLEETKRHLIPSDGIIMKEKKVNFNDGESVFDVLLRETRNDGIHMEFVKSPVYDSAYIEGIHNLYEFDCGELSGWMYSVNGWFPNYGCSKYTLNNGDSIVWVYTCDLGNDVK